jgi:predicted transcriptional regulator
LNETVQSRTEKIEKLEVEIGRLTEQKDQLKSDIKNRSNGTGVQKASESDTIRRARQQRSSKKQEAMQRLVEIIRTKPNATLSELAIEIGRSKSTVGGYLSELQVAALIEKGEFGWQVVEDVSI